MDDVIKKLYSTIIDRKINKVKNSYTNYLFAKGKDKILKKFGEEAIEVVIAAKNLDKQEQINEISDLLYHLIVLMAELEINLSEIDENLEIRNRKMGNLKTERKNIEIL